MGKLAEDLPPMGLRSGGSVVVSSCGGGGGGGSGFVVVEEPLNGGGGGSGHTMDPVTGEPPPSSSLALDLGTRVLVCLPCGPTWILVVRLGAGLSGESSTGMISMGSSLTMVTLVLPPSDSMMRVSSASSQPSRVKGPNRG
jgi:hypothetical protein